MAKVQVLCGAHRSQRCAQIDQVMRSHWGRSLLLTPTHGYARVRRERLLLTGAAQGCWGNPVREFKDFVVHLLAMEGMHVRLLEDFERLLLLEQALAGETVAERVAALNLSTENSGFLRHLLAVITQLKQAAVEPEVFQERIKDGETHPFDALVATAYEAYQAMLASSNTYDVPGLYWQASLAAHSKAPRALQGIEVLLLDGFDDFTPSQLRLLATLSKHFDTIVFGINYEDVPNRQDLYTLSAKTLAQLRDCFDVEMVQLSSSAPRRYSEYAADQLFWRDKPVMPSDLAVDVRGVPCMDYAQETEVLARRIKKLVVEEGVPPEDIALVYRGLQGVASQLKRTFDSFEIPLRMSHQPNLCESAVGAFVLRFFEAISEWGTRARFGGAFCTVVARRIPGDRGCTLCAVNALCEDCRGLYRVGSAVATLIRASGVGAGGGSGGNSRVALFSRCGSLDATLVNLAGAYERGGRSAFQHRRHKVATHRYWMNC